MRKPDAGWYLAAKDALQKFTATAQNDGAVVGTALTGAFNGATSAFLSFVQTGKLSFTSLATSILADIERIMIQKAIAGMVNMAVGAFTGSVGSTIGGTASPARRGGRRHAGQHLRLTWIGHV